MIFKEEATAMIRNYSQEMEKSGLVPLDVLTYIYDNKLFKIYLPEVLGGILLSLPETLIHQQEISEMELNQVSRVCKKAAKAALMSGHTIFPLLGIQAIMEHSTVNQI